MGIIFDHFRLILVSCLLQPMKASPLGPKFGYTQQHIPKSYVIRRSDLINFIIVLDSLQAPTPGQTNLDVKWKNHGFPFGKYLHMCLQMEGKHHITSIFNLQGIYLKHPGTAPSNLIAGKVGQHHPNRYRTLAYRDTYHDQTLLVSPSCAIEDTTHRSIRRCLHILVGGWWLGTFFYVSIYWEETSQATYFSEGLKPPTRQSFVTT
jgi:hypothetical protein